MWLIRRSLFEAFLLCSFLSPLAATELDDPRNSYVSHFFPNIFCSLTGSVAHQIMCHISSADLAGRMHRPLAQTDEGRAGAHEARTTNARKAKCVGPTRHATGWK